MRSFGKRATARAYPSDSGLARGWLSEAAMDRESLGRLIARLAVAVVAADARITTAELAALGRLDGLGLGSLAGVVREELERAAHEPVDVRATCALLPPLGEEGAALLLTALAELVAIDRLLAPREREVFSTVADHLGVDPAAAARILEAAISPPPGREPEVIGAPTPPVTAPSPDPTHQRAFRVLGLEPGASRSRIDTAYLDLVQRYDPGRVSELGPEFAALAVRRLATITDAYEVALGSLASSA
jgi:DnaJ-domain-containing protein 1